MVRFRRRGHASIEGIAANNLVSRYANANGIPDLSAIIRDEGITLKEMPDPDWDGASGQFVEAGADGKPTIYLNTKKSKTHQRFTLAHELGHYFLGHGTSMRDTNDQLRLKDVSEISANKFAAELTMPRKKILELHLRGYRPADISKELGVSEEAIEYRLKNIGIK